jgi:superfamily II DNA or RNA helicase
VAHDTGAPRWLHAIVRIRDERWRVERVTRFGDVDLLAARGCGGTNLARTGEFLLPFELVEPLGTSDAPRAVAAARWRHVARQALAGAQPSWSALRAAAGAACTIVPFQLEPALAFVGGHGCRLLIADAVGLGKTIQAGLMVAELHHRRPEARTLIVAPSSLRAQWQAELIDRFRLDPEIFDSAGLARCRGRLPAGSNPWSLTPIAITSIDFVKRPEVARALEALVWDLVIFDEAHNLAGRSDRYAAARALGARARAVVLLTATPHSGDERAFERLGSIGALRAGEPLLVFARSRADAGLLRRRRECRLHIRPTAAELSMHTALADYATCVWARSRDASATHPHGARLAMATLMRRACSSAASLARTLTRRLALLAGPVGRSERQPTLPFAIESLDDAEPSAGLETPGLADMTEERSTLRRLLALASDAARSESKPAALRRLVERAGEPAIVFTEYRDTLAHLATALAGIDCAELHGGLTTRQRQDALRRFTDGEVQVLLATDAASEGLNLHHRCRLVISLELPWSPLRLEQRIGRVDRIGQPRVVHAVRFVARGTCEETTLARLEERIVRARHAIGMDGPPPTEYEVADCVLGDGSGRRTVDTGDRRPAGLVQAALGHAAELEARRIAAARALAPSDANRRAEPRPVIARLRRRAGTLASRHGVWVFRITLSTRSGQVLWEPLVTLAARFDRPAAFTHRHLRLALDPGQAPIVEALDGARLDAVRRLGPSLQHAAGTWRHRELEIAADLRARHARLSAALMQRSLFGRERDRLAASQAALLDAALAQSAERLRALDALAEIEVEAVRLEFAAVVA